MYTRKGLESILGFGAPVRANMRNDKLTNASVECSDLIAYGQIPEFIGRFPILLSLSALTEDQLIQIWSLVFYTGLRRLISCSFLLLEALGAMANVCESITAMSALSSVYAKDLHVRLASLNVAKCIPTIFSRSVPQDVEIATSIWIALHDPEKSVAEVAEDLWDRYDHEFGSDYSGLFRALSHVNYNVRVAASDTLATILDEYRDTLQADTNADVRGRMINVGIMIIDKHGKYNVSLLFPIFENYLNKKGTVRVLALIVKLFSTSNAVASLTKAFENLLDRQLIEFTDRGHNQSIEFRAVKLLISSFELHQGFKSNRLLPHAKNVAVGTWNGFLVVSQMTRILPINTFLEHDQDAC
ncbi:unnamed protein product [Lactuca virosa]|uniref:Condensin complex subunit 1 C-terminal domain-containing protein n=1 Tax=Lactuca virosa TaxID=75947 RepID=A0AAU9PSH4_9ASTR|nr:unnamed protein product [Lactuca virosa]